jgi:hypothetical protein
VTDQEKRMQRAQLVIDCEDAARDLAHLREKSQRIMEVIHEVSEWLYEHKSKEPSPADFQPLTGDNREAAIRVEGKYREYMNINHCIKLTEELKSARGKLFNLKQRREALG